MTLTRLPLASRKRQLPLNACGRCGATSMPSSVSYHLKQRLDAGIVDREKRGSFAYFSLSAGALERVRSLLEPPAVPAAA